MIEELRAINATQAEMDAASDKAETAVAAARKAQGHSILIT
jgi:hypothetical protein